MLHRAWAAVKEARVQTGRGVGAVGTPGAMQLVPPAVETELNAVRDEVDNTRLVACLQSALTTGVAVGGPGALDLDTVDLTVLTT